MNDPIRRRDIEANARQFLERSRDVSASSDRSQTRVSRAAFDEVVQKEINQTIRQLRSLGKIVD